MIESISDFLSIVTAIGFVIAGIYCLVQVSVQHRAIRMRQLEDEYYRSFDVSDEENEINSVYYED